MFYATSDNDQILLVSCWQVMKKVQVASLQACCQLIFLIHRQNTRYVPGFAGSWSSIINIPTHNLKTKIK